METIIYRPERQAIEKCASIIRSGGLVAFPTETVYGLGASALAESGVRSIYAAKGRPSDNPLIVHVSDKKMIESVALFVPEKAAAVIEKLMPGPVTVVLERRPVVPDCVTGGLGTVAVRMPDCKVALDLISAAGVPVCAPSANTSGRPSPTCAEHVFADLGGKIPAILDGGRCRVGVESTVVDLTGPVPRLLRAGGMPLDRIEALVGKVELYNGDPSVALAPGMKYKHYSPKADVIVADCGDVAAMTRAYDEASAAGKRAVILASHGTKNFVGDRDFYDAGPTAESYAHELFAYLRRADDEHYDLVICEDASSGGLAASVRNRLSKASGGKKI